MSKLDLDVLRDTNVERSLKGFGHNLFQWSSLEWAGAAAGEMGEAANVAKKITRVEQGLHFRPGESDLSDLRDKLADEIADTIIYLDLLAAREGINLSEAIVNKFNRTTAEQGFDQLLYLT